MKTKVMIINVSSLVAIASLALGLAVSLLAFAGSLSHEDFKGWFLLVTALWFVSSPLWFVPGLFGEEFGQAGDRAWLRPKKK